MGTVLIPQEVGKGIADFGFLIIAGATYIVYSATLFFFLGCFSSCHTAKKCKHSTENNTAEYKEAKHIDTQQALTIRDDRTLKTIHTDSIIERMVIKFKPSYPYDACKQRKLMSVEGRGIAVITRHKKTLTEVLNTNSQTEAEAKNDTIRIQTSAAESKIKELQNKQSRFWNKLLPAGLLIVLTAFCLYTTFYLRNSYF